MKFNFLILFYLFSIITPNVVYGLGLCPSSPFDSSVISDPNQYCTDNPSVPCDTCACPTALCSASAGGCAQLPPPNCNQCAGPSTQLCPDGITTVTRNPVPSCDFPACPPPMASCVNPFGGANIPHGASITAYQAAIVACGSSCNSEIRTCNNGTLSGTYTQQACAINPPCAGCTDESFVISSSPVTSIPFPSSGSIVLPVWHADCSPPAGLESQIRITDIAWKLPAGVTINGDTSNPYLRTLPSSGGLTYNYKTKTPPPPPATCPNPFGGPNIAHGSSVTAYQTATVPCGNTCSSEVRTCNNGTLSGTYTNSSCTVDACPSTWLICLETIHYEDNCSPGSTYTYNQVTPADCSGHSDNTVDNGLCDAVNHSYDHFSYSSVMCTANGSACTSGAGCCSNSCQFISGSWQCAP